MVGHCFMKSEGVDEPTYNFFFLERTDPAQLFLRMSLLSSLIIPALAQQRGSFHELARL